MFSSNPSPRGSGAQGTHVEEEVGRLYKAPEMEDNKKEMPSSPSSSDLGMDVQHELVQTRWGPSTELGMGHTLPS